MVISDKEIATLIVATPPENDASNCDPKSIVTAVPTLLPPFLTTTPDPEATIPVNPEPSPENDDAVMIPVVLIPSVVPIQALDSIPLESIN